jgi:hypothetical protein
MLRIFSFLAQKNVSYLQRYMPFFEYSIFALTKIKKYDNMYYEMEKRKFTTTILFRPNFFKGNII